MEIITGRNELIPLTRRYPDLKPKQALRDSKIAKRIITSWDVKREPEETLNIFIKESSQLSHPRYWELMKSVWIIAGGNENKDVFRILMRSKRPFRHYFMTPEETKIFNDLPEDVFCYRACDGEDDGLSYTLDYEYAEKYRDMFGKELIRQRKVNKSDIFAYIDRNAESEVIIL